MNPLRLLMNKVFPVIANTITRRKIDKKSQNTDVDGETVLWACPFQDENRLDKASLEVLKAAYEFELMRKSTFEDKAKTNVIGVTISITLMMGASSFIENALERYDTTIFKYVIIVLYALSIFYMIEAGIKAMQVLTNDGVFFLIPEDHEDKNTLKLYNNKIGRNRVQNLIRNNSVYTSYECIRNSLVCLFVVTLLLIIPINLERTNTVFHNNEPQTFETFYAANAIEFLDDRGIAIEKVEQIIRSTVTRAQVSETIYNVTDIELEISIEYELRDGLINVRSISATMINE